MIASNLFDQLGVIVALPGAKCRHKHRLFDGAAPGEDPATVEARHTQALGLCQRCPSLNRCETWFLGLKPNRRPEGVIAGRINQPRAAERPRKAAV